MERAAAQEEQGGLEDDVYLSFTQTQVPLPQRAGDGEKEEDYSQVSSTSSPAPSIFSSARSLSTTSSTSSSSFFSRAESLDTCSEWDYYQYPPISECEEIPSRRWLPSPFRTRRGVTTNTTRLGSAAPPGSAAYWEQLLPPDVEEMVSRAVVPVNYSSKEDLYVRLCSGILIDHGSKCFALDRSTGKKCYLLSARELRIIWVDEARLFKWTCVPHSRFPRVARLPTVWWSGIHAEIDARSLSPGTTYVACLVFGYHGRAVGDGLDGEAQEATVAVGARASKRSVFLQPNYKQRSGAGAEVPRRRPDGWLELEMGEFAVGDWPKGAEAVAVRVSLERHEVRYDDESVVALVVEGMQVRPKHSPLDDGARGRRV